jgi:Zn-dependent membrane protease YugP
MQEGFFLLWFLSLGISLTFWLYLKIFLARYGRFQSRRKITGCELARQILDRAHFNRTAVNPKPLEARIPVGLRADQLFLSEEVYHGTQLVGLATSLREGVRLLEGSKFAFPMGLWVQARNYRRRAILTSWILVLCGILLPGLTWMTCLGQFLFISAFLLSLATLIQEGEVTRRAVSSLTLLEGFETDERVRIKRLLKAIRWTPLAELFESPLSLFFQNHKRKSYVLSKSE